MQYATEVVASELTSKSLEARRHDQVLGRLARRREESARRVVVDKKRERIDNSAAVFEAKGDDVQ